MASGTLGIRGFLKETARFPAVTVNGNWYVDQRVSIAKQGYTPIAIAGFSSANMNLVVTVISIESGGVLFIRLSNKTGDNVTNGGAAVDILYVKE